MALSAREEAGPHADREPAPLGRDVTLGEDLHQAGTGAGPHALAVCRDLIISLLRLAGHTSIARALRHHARHPEDAIALVARGNPTTQ